MAAQGYYQDPNYSQGLEPPASKKAKTYEEEPVCYLFDNRTWSKLSLIFPYRSPMLVTLTTLLSLGTTPTPNTIQMLWTIALGRLIMGLNTVRRFFAFAKGVPTVANISF
jgi:hypothetical protein